MTDQTVSSISFSVDPQVVQNRCIDDRVDVLDLLEKMSVPNAEQVDKVRYDFTSIINKLNYTLRFDTRLAGEDKRWVTKARVLSEYVLLQLADDVDTEVIHNRIVNLTSMMNTLPDYFDLKTNIVPVVNAIAYTSDIEMYIRHMDDPQPRDVGMSLISKIMTTIAHEMRRR